MYGWREQRRNSAASLATHEASSGRPRAFGHARGVTDASRTIRHMQQHGNQRLDALVHNDKDKE
jgi:hypothetical protein